MTMATDWPTYLAEFHATNPGITEDVLARCTADGQSPYNWLTESLDPASRILDLACGSGPAKPIGANRWAGLDLSTAELTRARRGGIGALMVGDATALPIGDACADSVTCSMALMLVQPLDLALAEIRRTLTPNGRLLLLLPALRPLHMTDRAKYLRLFLTARSTTKFPPSELRRQASAALARHGLQVESDETRRFTYPLVEASDANRFVDSWYLPGTGLRQRESAKARARSMVPGTIGIPLRRAIARRVA